MTNLIYTLRQLILYFLKLGTFGFGGPAALVGYMHRDLVEQRNWIADQDYKEGLALAQLAPGPLAAQLSIYLGYIHFGIPGATVTGIAFVLPSFLMVLGLGFLYVNAGGLVWMQAVFYGVGASIIGIIWVSVYRLSRKNLGDDWLLWMIAFVLAIATIITESEFVFLMLAAGVVVWLFRAVLKGKHLKNVILFSPTLLQVIHIADRAGKLEQIAWFFFKAGAFVFGSGLAIVPFLYGGVVKEYHWLNERQFLDAVAVAMITPGRWLSPSGLWGIWLLAFPEPV